MVWAHLLARRTLIWSCVFAAVAIVLAFIPLFDVLGFEFSFVMGLVASFGSADLAATLVRRARYSHGAGAWTMLKLFAAAASVSGALLTPPLIVVCLNALRVRQCDFAAGFLFYAALPVMATLFGAAAGIVAATWTTRPLLGAVTAWLVPVASLALGVRRFYTAPPIFVYDAFGGYFPGSLYDEDVSLGAPFWWARAHQASFAVAALALCAAILDRRRLALRIASLWEEQGRVRALVLGVAAAATGVLLSARSAALGFSITASDIAQALDGRVETEHFTIAYSRTPELDRLMEAIATEHELRYSQVTRALGIEPTGKITSFYFKNSGEKRRWMGAANVDVAKPWRREIYLEHQDFPHRTLRHEIAHVVAGAFGDDVFGVAVSWWGFPPARFNVGLIEGIAVAADWPGRSGHTTPHQSARAMKDLGFLPPISALLAPGFLEFSSARSYTAAGSFVHYLLDRFGADKLRALYRSGGSPASFSRTYGLSLADLERSWHQELDAVLLDDENREVAREQFRRGGLFERPCPHAVARRLSQAESASAPDAVRILHRVCRDDPGEPQHRLLLADAFVRADQLDKAAEVYRLLGGDRVQSAPIRAHALLSLADLEGRRGDLARARVAAKAALLLPLDEDTRRNLNVRWLAFDEQAEGAAEIRAYVLAKATIGEPNPVLLLVRAYDVAKALPKSGFGHYLVGRVLSSADAYEDAARELALAAHLGLTDPLVRRENDRLLTRSAFLAGDFETTQAAALRLAAPDQPLAVQALGQDWLERCARAASRINYKSR